MWHVTPVTPATVDAVSLDEAKRQLRIEHDLDDVLIQRLILTATAYAERETDRTIMRTQLRAVRCDWSYGRLILPRGPVTSIVTVDYYDSTNTQVTGFADYQVVNIGGSAELTPAAGTCWPALYRGRADAVGVTYYAGAATAADVPPQLVHAILMLVSAWYRFDSTVEATAAQSVPMGATALLAQMRNVLG